MSADLEEVRARAAAHDGVLMFYDGVCGLCDRAVQFLLARDRRERILFVTLQSDFAAEVLRRHGRDPERLDSMILVRDYGRREERLADRTDGAFGAARELGGVWGALARVALWCPRFIRDPLYRLVARLRYRLFGRFDTCRLPDARVRARFLA